VMPLQGSLSIERMCQLAGVSRAGFYRSLQDRTPVEEDMEVRSVIQQIAVEHWRCGIAPCDRRLYDFYPRAMGELAIAALPKRLSLAAPGDISLGKANSGLYPLRTCHEIGTSCCVYFRRGSHKRRLSN